MAEPNELNDFFEKSKELYNVLMKLMPRNSEPCRAIFVGLPGLNLVRDLYVINNSKDGFLTQYRLKQIIDPQKDRLSAIQLNPNLNERKPS